MKVAGIRLVLLPALAGALALGATSMAAPATQPATGLVAGAEESVLRLHDLPAGYVIGGNSFCGPSNPSEEDRGPLDRWIVKYRPAGCNFEYERYFQVPGLDPAPPVVAAETINTRSEKAAARGFVVAVRTIAEELEGEARGTVPIPGAPPARLFRIVDVIDKVIEDDESRPASLLLWRHGTMVAAIEVSGESPQQNDRLALHFAQIQQGRMESPSPYLEAERDDTEVPLEDPGLKVPVYWLGTRFAPPGLSPMRLVDAFSSTADSPQTPGITLLYGDHPDRRRYAGVFLNVWSRKQWLERHAEPWNLPGSLDCATSHPVKPAEGSAVALHGWAEHNNSCRGRHHVWTLRVHLGGVVITAETTTICATCAEAGIGTYNSYREMATIARGLTLRPAPAP